MKINLLIQAEYLFLMDVDLQYISKHWRLRYNNHYHHISSGDDEEFLLNNAFVIFGNPTLSPFFMTANCQISVSTNLLCLVAPHQNSLMAANLTHHLVS